MSSLPSIHQNKNRSSGSPVKHSRGRLSHERPNVTPGMATKHCDGQMGFDTYSVFSTFLSQQLTQIANGQCDLWRNTRKSFWRQKKSSNNNLSWKDLRLQSMQLYTPSEYSVVCIINNANFLGTVTATCTIYVWECSKKDFISLLMNFSPSIAKETKKDWKQDRILSFGKYVWLWVSFYSPFWLPMKHCKLLWSWYTGNWHMCHSSTSWRVRCASSITGIRVFNLNCNSEHMTSLIPEKLDWFDPGSLKPSETAK